MAARCAGQLAPQRRSLSGQHASLVGPLLGASRCCLGGLGLRARGRGEGGLPLLSAALGQV